VNIHAQQIGQLAAGGGDVHSGVAAQSASATGQPPAVTKSSWHRFDVWLALVGTAATLIGLWLTFHQTYGWWFFGPK
jgi:hypothetical protein